MKKFIFNIAAYLTVLIIITLVVNAVYINRTNNYGTMGEQKNDSAYVLDVPEEIEICNFGNSHGYYGFNYSDLSCKYTCFNFALPSQTISYDFKILQNYKDRIAHRAYVFICISYTTFFGEPEIEEVNFESKNKRYYHFLQDEYIKEYNRTTDLYVNYFPALATTPSDLVLTILKGPSRNVDMWDSETSAKAAKEHAPGRFNSHIATCVDENGKRIYNEEEIKALYDMIELCREVGAIPVLIITPYLSEYTDQVWEKDSEFYEDLYGIIQEVVEKEKVEFYDYSMDERFCNDYSLFFNTDHMNRVGAKKFVDILGTEVITKVGGGNSF